MRYLLLLCTAFALTHCAPEMTAEELSADSSYAFPGRVAESEAFPIAQPDTNELPHAGDNDEVTVPPGTPAPTPYGMVIQDGTAYDGTKGVDPSNNTAPALAAQRMLTGRWENADDSQEVVAFTPTHYATYYDGEMLVEENMSFHGVCPDACSGGTSTGQPCFTISGPAQTDCYGIVQLTEDVLQLRLLGVSTETVIYRRAD